MRKITQSNLAPGVTVLIAAFDDIPEHLFLVEEVLEDCITGQAITGPLVGAYGEPELGMILKVLPKGTEPNQS